MMSQSVFIEAQLQNRKPIFFFLYCIWNPELCTILRSHSKPQNMYVVFPRGPHCPQHRHLTAFSGLTHVEGDCDDIERHGRVGDAAEGGGLEEMGAVSSRAHAQWGWGVVLPPGSPTRVLLSTPPLPTKVPNTEPKRRAPRKSGLWGCLGPTV